MDDFESDEERQRRLADILRKFQSKRAPLTDEEIENIVKEGAQGNTVEPDSDGLSDGIDTEEQDAVEEPPEKTPGVVMPKKTDGAMFPWLVNYCRKRIKAVRPLNLVFTGETGSGKSYSAIRLASVLDPTFSEDHIVFDIESFLGLLEQRPRLPPGSVIMYDEAGVTANSRKYRDTMNIIFSGEAQSMRYRNYPVFYTVPKLSFIDSQVRGLVQMILESTSTRGKMKPLFILDNPDRNDPKPFYKYPSFIRTRNFRQEKVVVSRVTFQLPPKYIYMPYEKKKDEFLSNLRTANLEKIDALKEKNSGRKASAREADEDKEEHEEPRKKDMELGVKMICGSCKYIWQYTKPAWKVNCPRCHAKLEVPEQLKKYTGIQHVPLTYRY